MFLVSLINNWLISISLSCRLQYYALLNFIILLADPSLVLPALVRLVYSSDERVHLSAADALIRVLKYHNQKVEVIFMLLDCLRYLAFCPPPHPHPFPFSLPIPKVQLILSKVEFVNGKRGKHLLEEERGVLTATQTFDQLKLIILSNNILDGIFTYLCILFPLFSQQPQSEPRSSSNYRTYKGRFVSHCFNVTSSQLMQVLICTYIIYNFSLDCTTTFMLIYVSVFYHSFLIINT